MITLATRTGENWILLSVRGKQVMLKNVLGSYKVRVKEEIRRLMQFGSQWGFRTSYGGTGRLFLFLYSIIQTILFSNTLSGLPWHRPCQVVSRHDASQIPPSQPLRSSTLYPQSPQPLDPRNISYTPMPQVAAFFGFFVPYFDLAVIRFPTPPCKIPTHISLLASHSHRTGKY